MKKILYNRLGKRIVCRVVPASLGNIKKSLKWEELKLFITEQHDDCLLPLPEKDCVIFSRTPGAGKNIFMALEVAQAPALHSLYGKGKRPVTVVSYHKDLAAAPNAYILIALP